MKVINVNASDLSVNAILAEWAKAESEKEKIKAAAMADAMLTLRKDKLTPMEKAKLLQVAAYIDKYHVKKIVSDIKMGEEVAEITTEFVTDMCKIADKYEVDRDKHMINIVTTLAALCAERSFKGIDLSEGHQ